VLEKPLPPLPVEGQVSEGDSDGEGGVQDQDRKRRRSSASERSARMGECAWWTKEVGESGSEGEGFERELAMKGWLG